MPYHLREINRRVRSDVRGFLEESDEVYHKKVSGAAEHISQRARISPVVFLSGPSGSGKTTTAEKISAELQRRGIRSHTISMDDYYKTIDPCTAPRSETGEIDYESPELLDTELLREHFSRLESGGEILIPRFDFVRQVRSEQPPRPFRLGKNEIAIFEGIHALNDRITGQYPQAYRLYISARSNVEDGKEICFKGTWIRLVRRIVRDYQFRGNDAEYTMRLWAGVRRGEKLYISPYKESADLLFDSSLPYEVSVLKNLASRLLTEIPPDVPRRAELCELVRNLELFESIEPALVEPDSLLREFIGGET